MCFYKNKSFIQTNIHKSFKIVLCFIIIWQFSACQSSKYLKSGEYHLNDNDVEFETDITTKEQSELESEIKTLYLQNPNKNIFLFVPREYIYYRNSQPHDTTWFNRFARKYIGEIPTIYDEEKTIQTNENIEKYLINKKGFFDAHVNYSVETDSLHRKKSVQYNIDLQTQYTIKSLAYLSEDTVLLDIVQKSLESAHIHVGDKLDETYFNLEKSRISNLLQNIGYADFNTKYIQIKGDSTDNNKSVDIVLDIKTPRDNEFHLTYTVGNINIHTDYNKSGVSANEVPVLYEAINYYKIGNQFVVKPEVMNTFIYILPGTLHSKSIRKKTYRKLSQLSPYKFVNIDSHLDKEKQLIHYDIYLTPFQKVWNNRLSGDFYYSNSTNNKLGISLNKSFLNRNLFRGAEFFTLDLSAGLEFQFIKDAAVDPKLQIDINQDFKAESKIDIPKLFDFTGQFRFLKKLNFISEKRYKSLQEETNTEIKVNYNYLKLARLYDYHRFNLSFGYDYQPSPTNRLYYEPIALTVFNPTPTPEYDSVLMDIPLLKKSFSKSFISGLIFSNLAYNYYKRTRNGRTTSWFGKLEISGLENFLYNSIYGAVSDQENYWDDIAGVAFSRFIKFDSESRYAKKWSKNAAFASRFNFGIAVPFGRSEVIPYIKQFFIGGPNSIRAWSDRELGPGSHQEVDSITNSFFQTGDILLEANVEYRYDLFQNNYMRIEFATFVDAGNIWTIKKDSNRPGAIFSTKFYNQIAVGAGYGFRFDFDFVLVRFDFAYKLRNPYPNEKGNYWDPQINGLGNFNLALSHPF